jgi:uncharacterized protein related to proFAR isomerase
MYIACKKKSILAKLKNRESYRGVKKMVAIGSADLSELQSRKKPRGFGRVRASPADLDALAAGLEAEGSFGLARCVERADVGIVTLTSAQSRQCSLPILACCG